MRHYEIFGCTETGYYRNRNEDHILLGRFIKNRGSLGLILEYDDELLTEQGLLFAVADGVGGAKSGDTASRLAIATLERLYYNATKEATVDEFRGALESAMRRANKTVLWLAESRSALAGMGSTLAGVCLFPTGFWVFGAGDSRVYHSRGQTLTQLTVDDTLQALNVRLSRSDENNHRYGGSHALVNWLGNREFHCKIEQGPTLKVDDKLLICSDGLHDLVAEEDIIALLAEPGLSLAMRGHRLIGRALERGGWDNVSVILVGLQQTPSE